MLALRREERKTGRPFYLCMTHCKEARVKIMICPFRPGLGANRPDDAVARM